jgi:formate-dependent phosphoribosylglycinamide formyltransferase (GAR transformylase)
VPSVLFVGAGRHQRRAILQARERGLTVVAVDRNPAAPGLRVADVREVVDFVDVDAVEDVARRHAVDGVLTVSADRAVPVVAAVAERLGLPSIGSSVAHRLTHKIAMRRVLAEEGLPQPAFAAVRNLAEGRAAIESVGLPAVLKPVDSGGQRGVFRIDSPGDLESHLHAVLAESPGQEAIYERYVDGTEMNGIVIVRGGDARLVTLSDRLRPPGIGFGVGWIHVYPASIHSDQLERAEWAAERSVVALGLRDGIALPRFSQPLAIRFLTAQPGPLPTGTVTRIGSLDAVLASQGVVQAETYLIEGETIRPVRLDGDRRGYVIATADTSFEALERAERAALLVEVEVE